MVRTKGVSHKFCRASFNKVMKSLNDKKVDLYALFYRGFRTGINFQRKQKPTAKATKEKG